MDWYCDRALSLFLAAALRPVRDQKSVLCVYRHSNPPAFDWWFAMWMVLWIQWDAFPSYQPKERKLEILKDSHIGAFAVIMLAVYGLIYMGAFSEITDKNILQVVCAGFVLARVLSGIGVVSFPSAKKEGMLYLFQDHADAVIVKVALYMQGALCIGFMLWKSFFAGGAAVIAAFAVFRYYKYRTKKELGGITGDTAGYFLLLCEGVIVVITSVVNILLKSEINI